jgi:glycosyltransferase involved in cell wall biosynthesis
MKYNMSIIIPFFNSKKFIKKNFANIYNIQKKYDKIEAIYVDNNSSDSSYEILKKKYYQQKISAYIEPIKKKNNHQVLQEI